MSHAARRQVGAVDIGESGLGASVLLGVVIFPLDADGAVISDAIQLDQDFFNAVGVTLRPGRDKIPAVESMAHGPMAAEETRPRVLATHLHSFNMSAMNPFAEFTDELDHTDALPFHMRAVQVEAYHIGIAGLVHRREIITG